MSTDERRRFARWTEISDDPNASEVIAHRSSELTQAWVGPVPDRTKFIVERCRGRRVLDIGCVDHPIETRAKPSWLHRHITAVAAECVGVDINGPGVEALTAQGFTVLHHDITTGTGALVDLGTFEVIVGGEILEHLSDPLRLFEAAAQLLGDDGRLILTTPNPYAPHRWLAGMYRQQWENVDHLMYAFPSGVAELAARVGLCIEECTTTAVVRRQGALRIALADWLKSWRPAGPGGTNRRVRTPVWAILANWRRWNSLYAGETAIYTVCRPRSPSGPTT